MKRLFQQMLIVCLLGMVFVANPSLVSACSGGAPLTLKGLIKSSDYVVKARVAEMDDAKQNAILRIDSYLAGGRGPEYLLLINNDPVFTEYILAGRSNGGDCLGLFRTTAGDDPMYLFLSRDANGSYGIVTTLFNAYAYTFPTPDATVEVFLKGGIENGGTIYEDYSEKGDGQDVTEQEFIQLIAQESGEQPHLPMANAPYPLKSPLKFTTATGTQYVLPIDGELPYELTAEVLKEQERRYPLDGYGFSDAGRCDVEGCKSISPDGINIAVQTDENTITVTWGHEIVGQASLFSATSDSIAVWNECQLTIYTLGYPRLLQGWYEVEEVQHIELNGTDDCASVAKLARWSPDGRLLAYSDEQGLWLWDTFNLKDKPHLLVAALGQTIPLAKVFSPLSNYLSVIDGNNRYTLDVLSGATLPDGLISPDDRLILKFDTSAETFDLEVCAIVPYTCQPIGYMYISVVNDSGERTMLYDGLSRVSEAEWINKNKFIVLICAPDDQTICAVYQWYPNPRVTNRLLIADGIAFDFDTSNDALAILQDANTVIVDNQTYDLSAIGEIVSIEWMPSLFYRE